MSKAEWKNGYQSKKRINPVDRFQYFIGSDVIEFTERILSEYGNHTPNHEGIVYWAGLRKADEINVMMAIAPEAVTNPGMVKVSHFSNLNVILALSASKMVHLGQVHSHPSDWIDHSGVDDREAAFKTEGLLSIVVPDYGDGGMKDLAGCGVHRFRKTNFIRLGEKYINAHFQIKESFSSLLIDQRNGIVQQI